MIEQHHEVVADAGTVYRWRVDHPTNTRGWQHPPAARPIFGITHDELMANLAVRVAWCGDVLGPENNGRTWRITSSRALFANQEDAMMYQLAWS